MTLTTRLLRDLTLLAYDAANLAVACLTCTVIGHDGQWHDTTIGRARWCDRCGKTA